MKRALLPLAISVFAFGIRLPVLRQGLWEDEATAVFVARSPTIHEFFRRQEAVDYSPPLFNAVLAGYGRLFGFGEVPLKVLAIGLGALACGAIALAAAEMFGVAAGAISGVLAVLHPLLIEMAAEVRPYSLSALTVALFLWSLFRFRRHALEGARRRTDLVLYAAFALLAAESHYAGTAAVAAVGMFALLASVRRSQLRIWLPVAATTAIVGFVLLPWAPIAWRQLHVGLPWAIRSSNVTMWGMALFKAKAVFPLGLYPAGIEFPLGLALCAAAGLASYSSLRTRLSGARTAAGIAAIAAVAAFFAVGLAGAATRYVTVPTALVSILLGGLASILYASARDTGRVEATFALIGLTILVTLVVRKGVVKEEGMIADFHSGRSRSLVRDLCREGRFRPADLVIAAPDMLGPTFWYYLPEGVTLRGFVHWTTPAFADFSDYSEKWRSPGTVPSAVSALGEDVRASAVRRILLAYAVGNDNPLPFRTRTRQLREAISGRYALVSSEICGSGEKIQLDVWDTTVPSTSAAPPARTVDAIPRR